MTPDQERALKIATAITYWKYPAQSIAAEILRAEARGMHRVLFGGAGLENPEDRLATLEAQAAELEQAK